MKIRVIASMFDVARRMGINLPKPELATHEFGSPVVIPPRPHLHGSATLSAILEELEPCSKAPQRKHAQDIAGFDRRADREARWRRDECLELERLVPFMKNAGVKPEIIEHAEEVLRDLQEHRRRKYPNKGPE